MKFYLTQKLIIVIVIIGKVPINDLINMQSREQSVTTGTLN